MSLQNALAFLHAARRVDVIIRELGEHDELSWDDLVRIGTEAGFDFTQDELARAHTVDWQMRRARYS